MIELSVCIGSACHLKGSYNIVQTFQQLIEEHHLHEKIDFKASFCMKECNKDGVSIIVDGTKYNLESERAREFFKTTIMPLVNFNKT